MEDYIQISLLNDFTFCPYSIYLHNVYKETSEDTYHAVPQVNGRLVHKAIDEHSYSSRRRDLTSINVFSDKLGISGKIDLYREDTNMLIERKFKLKYIFKGHLYQIWAQYFCMVEMGFVIDKLAFYEISSNKTIPVYIPGEKEFDEIKDFIKRFKEYSPEADIITNPNKCKHCIYCNLCEKTNQDNVYT